jgi:hypothetical protein
MILSLVVKLLPPAIAGLCLLATLPACKGEGPVDIYLRFVEALAERDATGAWACLSRATRERLSQASARLAEMAGGAVKAEPQEMLVVSSLSAARGKRAVTVAKEGADRVELKVTLSPSGDALVTLLREDGEWRILLPEPSGPAARTP